MWKYNYTQDNNELCHYGVLGMKWGKRKFQERGGSYTKKGLKVFENKMNKYQIDKIIYRLKFLYLYVF